MFKEEIAFEEITVTVDNELIVTHIGRIFKQDELVSSTHNRVLLVPGSNLDEYDDRVKAVAGVIWTQQVMEAYAVKFPEKAIILHDSVNTEIFPASSEIVQEEVPVEDVVEIQENTELVIEEQVTVEVQAEPEQEVVTAPTKKTRKK